jgi:cytochrome c
MMSSAARIRLLAGVFAMLAGGPVLAGAAPEAARGERLFMQCAACHSMQPTPGGLGPPLAGIVGRAAAATPGYPYSAALSGAGLQWDEATLNRWLERPNQLVPGTKMIFAGISNPADRLALIAYLKAAAGAAAK